MAVAWSSVYGAADVVAEGQSMASAVYQKIKKEVTLPSPTGTALEILRLTQDEKTTLPSLAAVIEKDPAIASRLLRFVNSPFVGMPTRIGSISQTVMLLGLQTVKVTGISMRMCRTRAAPFVASSTSKRVPASPIAE